MNETEKKEGTGVQVRTVGDDDHDTRLDKWFFKNFPGLGKGALHKLIRKGQVRIDGKRAKPDSRVFSGNEVRVPPMPGEAYQPFKTPPKILSPEDRRRALDFIRSITLYEDKDVLVLNKPHDLATQGGSKIVRHVDGMIEALADGKVTPKLVHRLDKETSGVLLIAKNAQTARALGAAFKTRQAQKYYWAVVAPAPQMNDGVIEAHIAKGSARGGEYMMVNTEEGKYSKTEYIVAEKAFRKAAFIVFKPETGRTHQLRLHAQLIGSPIVGDSKYKLDLEYPVEMEDLPHTDKLHLHARRLVVPHPSGKGIIDVTAPLPPHMAETFAYFNFDPKNGDAAFEA